MLLALATGARAQAYTQFCPAELGIAPIVRGSESGAQSAEFASWLWAGGPRTVLKASLVADTDHGWYVWDVADLTLSSKSARGLYSTPVVVKFPQPLAIRHAWVSRVRSSGDPRFDGTTDGDVDCDPPAYPGPLPKATSAPRKAASIPDTAQTVSAVQVAAPVASDCAHPFASATVTHPVQPIFPLLVASSTYTAQVTVAVGDRDDLLDSWIYKTSGDAAIDQSALRAARASSYASAVAYCRKVKGFYLFRADFQP